MRVLIIPSAIIALNLAWISTSQGQEPAVINKAVSECLNFVHSFPADPTYEPFFKKFDAYYNPGTGLVENNAMTNGDQAALFQFNKCMVQHGVPLQYKNSN